MDLMGAGVAGGMEEETRCTICVLVSWGRWALTQHTWGLMFTPRPTHTVTRLTRARAHTLSHVCSVACTLSDTAQLTHSDMLRSHPAYTQWSHIPSNRIPLTCLDTTTHSGVLRLEHDHALKHYHTLTFTALTC